MPPETELEPKVIDPAAALPVAIENPSPAPEVAAAPAPESNTPAEPKTIMEAALLALAPKTADGAATAAKPAGAPDGTPSAQSDSEDASQGEALDGVPMLPDDEFKALPQTARKAFVDLRKQVRTLKPDADRGQAVSQYMRDANLSAPEYADLLDAGALIKSNPAKARELLVAKIAEIDGFLGNTLSDDLRQEVDGGYITEERAQELSRTRATAAHATNVAKQHGQADQMRAVLTGVSEWETQTRSADPDFDRLLPEIQDRTKLLVMQRERDGKPVGTAAEAVQITREAYDHVKSVMRKFMPAPTATRPAPSSAASAPAATAAPRTILEAARAGLSGR